MNYGLTYKQTRSLAYEYATALKKCPIKWTEKKEAGIEWLKGFMKRHKDLSLRKPENTSLSRSTSFKKHNVTQFYDNYEKVLKRKKFAPECIYNLDETNIMTVVQGPNVIARKGTKQIGQCVSAERGQLITMCGIVNAIGNALQPVFIFPRARFHDSMLFGAPTGSVGYANSPTSGGMTGPLFIKVLEHLKRLTRCSKEDPILLLMDNHESHCTLDATIYCRENGIVALTFPPHCTHRMQPLDVSVNGSFKQKLSVAQNDWLLSHPGKTITIHDLASIVTPAYNASYIARNIIAGFMKPGIHPFSRNAFCDEDFECAEVTNRPMPTTSSDAFSDVLQTTSAAADTDCEEVEQEINFEDSPPATALYIPVSTPVSPSIIYSTSAQLVVSDVGPSLSLPEAETISSITEFSTPPMTSAVSPPSTVNCA
ncbi:hypothetical protein HF086_017054 [Spodoptera exigua]|uniref:DDE-1 domain-containing protein n=1 Tax=Spodoptera exigua TaxID=7107 RepID=A0A922SCJ5_SPOEX|nr:hypothetical protein HF086_017054 [Spodoptera exigua]